MKDFGLILLFEAIRMLVKVFITRVLLLMVMMLHIRWLATRT
jgi:hypothetical protein